MSTSVFGLDPMVWLTIGLVIFAAAQVWIQYRSEHSRRNERKADQEQSQDQDFQLVWAEQFRVEQLAKTWEHADLVELSALGVLQPTDMLSDDQAQVFPALTRLGLEPGVLGGVARALCHDIAGEIARLNGIVGGFAHQYPKYGPQDILTVARTNRREELARHESKIKTKSKDLGLLFWDAVRHSPRADLERIYGFKDDMWSIAGKEAVEILEQRATGKSLS